MAASPKDEIKLAIIQTDISYIKEKINSVDQKVSSNYVTKEEYGGTLRRVKLLEKIVYGAVTLILIAVLGALVSSVLRNK